MRDMMRPGTGTMITRNMATRRSTGTMRKKGLTVGMKKKDTDMICTMVLTTNKEVMNKAMGKATDKAMDKAMDKTIEDMNKGTGIKDMII